MKLLFFAIILLVPFAAHADSEADSELQYLGFVVSQMDTIQVGATGQYKAKPSVWNAGGKQYVSMTTTATENPVAVYKAIVDYMSVSVGSATSSVKVNGDQLIITYEGVYNPDLKPRTPIENLVAVLKKFPNPSLGGYVCTQKAFQSASGWVYVGITIPLNGTKCKVASDKVYNYLSANKYLDRSTAKKVTCFRDNVLLELWNKK